MTVKEAMPFKIFVGNEEMSKKVQEKLFKNNIYWAAHKGNIQHDRNYLFIYERKYVSYTNYFDYFYLHEFKELTLTQFFELEDEEDKKTDLEKELYEYIKEYYDYDDVLMPGLIIIYKDLLKIVDKKIEDALKGVK